MLEREPEEMPEVAPGKRHGAIETPQKTTGEVAPSEREIDADTAERAEQAVAIKRELDESIQVEYIEFQGTRIRITTEMLREGENPVQIVEFAPADETEIKDDVPIVASPAFQQDAEKYRAFFLHLAALKRRVLVVESPFGIEENNAESIGLQERDYPKIQSRKAAAILMVMEERNINQCDFFGQSEGSLNGMLAARESPKQFRSMFLSSTPGFEEDDSGLMLFLRGLREMARGLRQNIRKKKGPQDERIGRRPGRDEYPYAVREARTKRSPKHGTDSSMKTSAFDARARAAISEMAEVDMLPLLLELQASNVPVVLLAGVEDNIYHMRTYLKRIRRKDVAGFVSLAGGHYSPQRNPEGLAKGMDSMITSIARRAESAQTDQKTPLEQRGDE